MTYIVTLDMTMRTDCAKLVKTILMKYSTLNKQVMSFILLRLIFLGPSYGRMKLYLVHIL